MTQPNSPAPRARDRRLTAYAALRSEGVRMDVAAYQLGISRATAYRYERWVAAGMVPEVTP